MNDRTDGTNGPTIRDGVGDGNVARAAKRIARDVDGILRGNGFAPCVVAYPADPDGPGTIVSVGWSDTTFRIDRDAGTIRVAIDGVAFGDPIDVPGSIVAIPYARGAVRIRRS